MSLFPFVPDGVIVGFVVEELSVSNLHLLLKRNVQVSEPNGSMEDLPVLQIVQTMHTLYIYV